MKTIMLSVKRENFISSFSIHIFFSIISLFFLFLTYILKLLTQ